MVNMSSAPFTSKSDEWFTPQDFYDRIKRKWDFTLDPCASDENHKCETYFTIKDDGLSRDWSGHTIFINPPYSKISSWLEKAYNEVKYNLDTIAVCLIPARTDTKYWHKFVMKANSIYFIKGRLKFGGSKTCAPFPSCLVVFDGKKIVATGPEIYTLEARMKP